MIRQMQNNDQKEIERVCEIWLNESYRVHSFVADDYRKFWFERQNAFEKEIKEADGYVYEEDGVIKGFMSMKNTYIRELYVDLQWQRSGIGTALLDLAKCCCTSLYLHVYVRNVESINWYLRRGFVITNTHEPKPQNLKQIKYVMVWKKKSEPASSL